MGKSRSSRHKVFSEEKKERKDKSMAKQIQELEQTIVKLRREIEELKADGKVAVKKEKKVPKVMPKFAPPSQEELEKKRQETLERVRKWRIETFGEPSDE